MKKLRTFLVIVLLAILAITLTSCATWRRIEPNFSREEIVRVFVLKDVKYVYTECGRMEKFTTKDYFIFAEQGDTLIYDMANWCPVDIIFK